MEHIIFPDISETLEPVAYYRSETGSIPLYLAVGDHQATVLGTCIKPGDMVINVGTGGQISYIDAGLEFGAYETRPFFDNCSLRAITQLPSGRSLNVLMNFILNIGREIYGQMSIPMQ